MKNSFCLSSLHRVIILISLAIGFPGISRGVDLFVIDFEDYSLGALEYAQPPQSEMFRWRTVKAPADIVTNVVHSGSHALRLGPRRASVNRRFDGGDGIKPLASMTQYYDFWVYAACEATDYTVVTRLRDVAGKTFMDVHFANNGAIKVLVGTNEKDNPEKSEDSGAGWTPGKWHRITLKLDVVAQKFQLYVDSERTPSGPWPLPVWFGGMLSDITFEGTDSTLDNNYVYYDDLHWSDTDPLAKK